MIPSHALDTLDRLGHFGWIHPDARTVRQQDAHAKALAGRVAFTLAPPDVPVGTKVLLTDYWKEPDVVADIGGKPFTGFYQFTGSCVGVSTGNACFTVLAVQRKLATNPTKAFVPWWPQQYGVCRGNEGDHGQGEGAVDSVMFKTLIDDGCLPADTAGLPQPFAVTGDGWQLSQAMEMQWSNPSGPCQQFKDAEKKFPLGSAATLNSTDGIVAAICNGYPVLDGCSMFVGHGQVDGNGVCLGVYDGRGGHSTTFQGYWKHPVLGDLLLYSNQWATSTYPEDGSGKGRCTVWMKRSSVDRLWQLGGSGGETAALSHLASLPAQPAVLEWFA